MLQPMSWLCPCSVKPCGRLSFASAVFRLGFDATHLESWSPCKFVNEAHQLRYTDARQIALQGIKELGASPGSGAMFASIARAAVICGNEDAASLNLKRAKKLLSQETDFSEAKLSSCSAA